MRWMVIWVLLSSSGNAFATEVCVDIDSSAWTQEQRNARQAIAHALAFNPGGQNLIPHSPSGAQVTEAGNTQICFTDPIFDVPTVITAQAMLDRYAVEEAARQAAATAEATQRVALETERTTLETDVDVAFTNWSSLTASQRIDALRKSMRLNRVYRRLGGS